MNINFMINNYSHSSSNSYNKIKNGINDIYIINKEFTLALAKNGGHLKFGFIISDTDDPRRQAAWVLINNDNTMLIIGEDNSLCRKIIESDQSSSMYPVDINDSFVLNYRSRLHKLSLNRLLKRHDGPICDLFHFLLAHHQVVEFEDLLSK